MKREIHYMPWQTNGTVRFIKMRPMRFERPEHWKEVNTTIDEYCEVKCLTWPQQIHRCPVHKELVIIWHRRAPTGGDPGGRYRDVVR